MGVSISTARWLAPASFFIDFGAQLYGMLSSPNMLDIHNAHLSFFSPQPMFIAAFFTPQQVIQAAWLWRLWRLDERKAEEKRELDVQVDYAAYYALGNVCIATWMIFWNQSQLKTSNIFVIINTVAQLFYVTTRLGRMDTSSWSSILTHLVSKTFAGIGVLDLLHNTSVAYFQDELPSAAVQALTGVGFAGASLASDWIFGGCMAYDLVALAVGQSGIGNAGWARLLGGYAAASTGIVGVKNWLRPPYDRGNAAYRQVDDSVE